ISKSFIDNDLFQCINYSNQKDYFSKFHFLSISLTSFLSDSLNESTGSRVLPALYPNISIASLITITLFPLLYLALKSSKSNSSFHSDQTFSISLFCKASSRLNDPFG